jgi:hypothetical protein
MKKLFFLAFIVCLFHSAFSQKKLVPQGIYEGGICADEAICGYWIIDSNSNFIFLNFLGDYLRYIGTGNCFVENDTIVHFSFKENEIPILDKTEIHYSSETKQSFDSIYIIGSLKNHQNQSVSALVIVNDKYQTISDTNGNFKFVFPRTLSPCYLTVVNKARGYDLVEFSLNRTNNYYTLNIIMPSADSTVCYSAYNRNPFFSNLVSENRIELRLNNVSKKKRYVSINATSISKNDIVVMLTKAKQKQPYLAANINWLIAQL